MDGRPAFIAIPSWGRALAGPVIGMAPLWQGLVLLLMVDIVWLVASPIRLSAGSWWLIASLCLAAFAGAWGTCRLPARPRLQMLFQGGAFMLLAWPALRVFNHLTMSVPLPFADQLLAAADAALGFDWVDYALWLDRRPWLLDLMDIGYTGLTTYSIVLFLLLLTGRQAVQRCRELMVLFFLSALACMTSGALFPAMAAAFHHGPVRSLFHHIDPYRGAYHVAHLVALRSDPAHILVLDDLPGLVTFPSFHTAMGVIAIYCARSTPWLFLPSMLINVLMIASTPLLGSHYFIDVLAGAAVAAAAIALVRRSGSSRAQWPAPKTAAAVRGC